MFLLVVKDKFGERTAHDKLEFFLDTRSNTNSRNKMSILTPKVLIYLTTKFGSRRNNVSKQVCVLKRASESIETFEV